MQLFKHRLLENKARTVRGTHNIDINNIILIIRAHHYICLLKSSITIDTSLCWEKKQAYKQPANLGGMLDKQNSHPCTHWKYVGQRFTSLSVECFLATKQSYIVDYTVSFSTLIECGLMPSLKRGANEDPNRKNFLRPSPCGDLTQSQLFSAADWSQLCMKLGETKWLQKGFTRFLQAKLSLLCKSIHQVSWKFADLQPST